MEQDPNVGKSFITKASSAAKGDFGHFWLSEPYTKGYTD